MEFLLHCLSDILSITCRVEQKKRGKVKRKFLPGCSQPQPAMPGWCLAKQSFFLHKYVQSWPKKCVIGCVILPAGAVARSRNLGQTFLANSVCGQFWLEKTVDHISDMQCSTKVRLLFL